MFQGVAVFKSDTPVSCRFTLPFLGDPPFHTPSSLLLDCRSMYIRVKRQKTTIFLHVEPTDTVLEVKQKLQDLVEQVSMF